jgi:transcriptional regulator with XRE-family HTH domain
MARTATAQVEPFAQRLKRLCQERAVSVERIAHLAWDPNVPGTSPANLRKILAGHRPFNLALAEALASVLQVSPTEFVEYRLAIVRRQFDEQTIGLDHAARNLSYFETAFGGLHVKRVRTTTAQR